MQSPTAYAFEMGDELSLSQPHQLVGGQRQNTEQPVTHHLGMALDHQVFAPELVLEPRIAALGASALVVADNFSRGKFEDTAGEKIPN